MVKSDVKESWSDLAVGWVPWCPCPQYHTWRLYKAHAQDLLEFMIAFRILVCIRYKDVLWVLTLISLSSFVTLYKRVVLMAYKLCIWKEVAGSRLSENTARVELEALLCSTVSHQQHRWTEGHQLWHYTGCAKFWFLHQKRHIFAFMKYKVIVQV